MLKLLESNVIKLTSFEGRLSDKAERHLMLIKAKESEHKYNASFEAYKAFLEQEVRGNGSTVEEGEKCV